MTRPGQIPLKSDAGCADGKGMKGGSMSRRGNPNVCGVDCVVQDGAVDWPVGTPVYLVNNHGRVELTETRSEAWLLGDGSLVVSVKGRAGGYHLARMTKREVANA